MDEDVQWDSLAPCSNEVKLPNPRNRQGELRACVSNAMATAVSILTQGKITISPSILHLLNAMQIQSLETVHKDMIDFYLDKIDYGTLSHRIFRNDSHFRQANRGQDKDLPNDFLLVRKCLIWL